MNVVLIYFWCRL